MVEATGVELSRDTQEIERLLHVQQLVSQGVRPRPSPFRGLGQSVGRAMRVAPGRGRLKLMTVALKAVLEQATRLSREERAELRDALDALDATVPQPPPLPATNGIARSPKAWPRSSAVR